MNDDINKRVFISYRRDVAAYVARAVFQDLRAHGWDVFMDVENIDSGEFDRIILNQIATRAHFIIVLTPGTLERCSQPGDWLRREIEYALETDRNIVPLLASGFDFTSNLAYMTGHLTQLKRRNGLNVPHDYFDEAMERLRTRYLKQPFYGAVAPAPADEPAAPEQRMSETAEHPRVTTDELAAETFFNQAMALNDNSPQEIELYTQAIEHNPKYAQAYNNRGSARQANGDLDGAFADYERALRLDPDYALAYCNRGSARQAIGDLEGALDDYDCALQLDPRYVPGYYNRGIARQAMGDLIGALADYDKALYLNPKYALAYCNRGIVRQASGDLDGALADFDRALRLDPNLVSAYNNRGWALALQGEYETALDDYNTSIHLDAADANAYDSRGYVLAQMGDFVAAERDFNKAIQLDETLASSYFERGKIRRARGEFHEALADFERYVALSGEQDFDHVAEVKYMIRDLKHKMGWP